MNGSKDLLFSVGPDGGSNLEGASLNDNFGSSGSSSCRSHNPSWKSNWSGLSRWDACLTERHTCTALHKGLLGSATSIDGTNGLHHAVVTLSRCRVYLIVLIYVSIKDVNGAWCFISFISGRS